MTDKIERAPAPRPKKRVLPRRPSTFRGGVHPHEGKRPRGETLVQELEPPPLAFFPVLQHLGRPAKPVVKKRDEVKIGQVLAEPDGFVSAPIHSSISGKVVKVETQRTVFGNPVPTIIVENDNEDEWAEGTNVECDPSTLSTEEKKGRIQAAGVVGMGGATFPTHVKLSPPPETPVHTVILNGSECEPFLEADCSLMLSVPDKIIRGLDFIMEILGAIRGVIAVETDKKDVAKGFERLVTDRPELEVRLVGTKYPQGGERQLIKALTGKEVPTNSPGTAVTGILVHNVASAFAIYEAVTFNRPLVRRIVTVSGRMVRKRGNWWVRLGTPIRALLEKAEVDPGKSSLVVGGPMMGMSVPGDLFPVTKGVSGIVVVEGKVHAEGPCIRCGRCVEACPSGFIPNEFFLVERSAGAFDEKRSMDCIECGACTYACPAKKPIIEHARLGKSLVMRERARQAAKAKEAEGK